MKKLTTKEYWVQAQANTNIELDDENIIKKWIDDIIGDRKIKNAIEIGCYPGKFLTILGKKGTILSGIDYIPNVIELEYKFKSNGYKVDEFINADFFEFQTSKKYECVMSFGFIEHFKNWEDVIQRHVDLVADEGYLIIEVPNFNGIFQRLPRFIFDKENFKRHNLKAMNLEKWNRIIEENGFEIISSNYFGGYMLWFEKHIDNTKVLRIRDLLTLILKKIKNTIYPDVVNHPSFSCVMGVIAKRKPTL